MAIARYNDEGRYLQKALKLQFSYKIPATAANAPTVIRDGKGAQVTSVSAIVSSVQTITFKGACQLPAQLTHATAQLHQDATSTSNVQVAIVADSYDPSARTIKVVYRLSSTGAIATATPVAADWVHIELVGPSSTTASDAA